MRKRVYVFVTVNDQGDSGMGRETGADTVRRQPGEDDAVDPSPSA